MSLISQQIIDPLNVSVSFYFYTFSQPPTHQPLNTHTHWPFVASFHQLTFRSSNYLPLQPASEPFSHSANHCIIPFIKTKRGQLCSAASTLIKPFTFQKTLHTTTHLSRALTLSSCDTLSFPPPRKIRQRGNNRKMHCGVILVGVVVVVMERSGRWIPSGVTLIRVSAI